MLRCYGRVTGVKKLFGSAFRAGDYQTTTPGGHAQFAKTLRLCTRYDVVELIAGPSFQEPAFDEVSDTNSANQKQADQKRGLAFS